MKRPILLDTDVLVDFFRGRTAAVAYLEAQADQIILSAIVVAELYASAKSNEEQSRLDEFFAAFPVIPINFDVAKIAGDYQRDFQASHHIGLADAIIAATAVSHHADLITFNTRHYPMFKGLKPPYVAR